MSEAAAPAARAFVRYDSDESAPVVLPGYLNAVPSIVEPGDVFETDADLVDDLTASDRFTESAAPASPNASLTKAALAEKIGLDPGDERSLSKDDLVAMADDHDRTHPPVPEIPPVDDSPVVEGTDNAGDGDTEENKA